MQKGQSQNCSVPKQQPRSRGWGALALVMVLAATASLLIDTAAGCRVGSGTSLGKRCPCCGCQSHCSAAVASRMPIAPSRHVHEAVGTTLEKHAYGMLLFLKSKRASSDLI